MIGRSGLCFIEHAYKSRFLCKFAVLFIIDMKIVKLLLLLLLPLYFGSCGNNHRIQTLQEIDSLINVCPDSAVIFLEHFKDSISNESQSMQINYLLLTIKASDKAYIPHTSDSLILQVLNYCKDNKDEKLLPEAYYYAGRVYRDLGDAPQAQDYFLKAIEATKNSSDYVLISKIYSQIGTLFLYQDVYDEAMKVYKQAYKYSLLANDNAGIVFSLRDIGSCFTAFSDADSALFYYKEAFELAEKTEEKPLINMMKASLSDLYVQLKRYDLAKPLLASSSDIMEQDNLRSFYSVSANLYYQMNNLDSAYYYSNLLLGIKDAYAQQDAHWNLTQIALKRGDCKSASKHILLYSNWSDSIQEITDNESSRKIQALYDYQLRERENNRLQEENAKQKIWNLSMFLTLVFVFIFIYIYILNNRHKKIVLKNRMKELERLKEDQYRRSSQFIEENKHRIQELETKLKEHTEVNNSMERLLQAQKEQILRMNSKIEADQQEQEFASIAFLQSDIYNKFHQAIDFKDLDDNDWFELRKAIDSTYKDFTSRLYALYPISNIELKICLLIKTNIPTSTIAALTGRSKSAITSSRKKLYEKIYGVKGTPDMWDNFILSF